MFQKRKYHTLHKVSNYMSGLVDDDDDDDDDDGDDDDDDSKLKEKNRSGQSRREQNGQDLMILTPSSPSPSQKKNPKWQPRFKKEEAKINLKKKTKTKHTPRTCRVTQPAWQMVEGEGRSSTRT